MRITSILLLIIGAFVSSAAARGDKFQQKTDPLPGQYIVVLQDQKLLHNEKAVTDIANDFVNKYGGSVEFVYADALVGFSVVGMSESRARLGAADKAVDYIEESGAVKLTQVATQSSPPSWGLDRIDQQYLPLGGSYYWNLTGAGVRAYIIDSGIRYSHNEFGGRAYLGADFIGSGGNDCFGHGTAVAGVAGGSTYGVAKEVSLVSVKIFDCSGNSSQSLMIAGINWVAGNRVLPAVANMSFTHNANSSSIRSAVAGLHSAGVVTVVAAGNNSQDACNESPANANDAYTVGASTITDQAASFSNYGSCVEIYAPGNGIVTSYYTSDSAATTSNGTSVAAPHVAGAAAQYLQHWPNATPTTVKNYLTSIGTTGVLTGASPNRLLLRPFAAAPHSIFGIQRVGTPNAYYWLTELTGSSYFQSTGTVTALPELVDNASFDHFLVGDIDNDGNQDVFGIKGDNTGSGMTELNVIDGSTGYTTYYGTYVTALHLVGPIGANYRSFGLGDYNLDGYVDLYYIKRENTGSGMTEVHILDGSTGYSTFLLHVATAENLTNSDAWEYTVGDYDADGIPDVIGVLENGTGTGQTEVHILKGLTNYTTFALHAGTVLGPTSTDWTFSTMDYNFDGRADLVAVCRSGPGGQTEVRVLNGALNYAAYIMNPVSTPIGNHKNYFWDFSAQR